MDAAQARARFCGGRVARLATADETGRPRVVPCTFAVAGDLIYTAVDHKPKTTRELRRLRDIRRNPRVSLLVDHYEEDWDRLWWVRADGRARILDDLGAPADQVRRAAILLLARRYEQYRTRPPEGPVIEVAVERWSGWSAASRGGGG